MIRSGHVFMAALTLATVACAKGDNAAGDSTKGDTAAVAGAMANDTTGGAGNMTVEAMAVNNSGVSASVTLTPSGEQTAVSMHVTGAQANATLPSHIHTGTCAAGGPVEMPLDSAKTDATGMAMVNSTVASPMTTVADGNHFVQVHNPDGKPAACGDIPKK